HASATVRGAESDRAAKIPVPARGLTFLLVATGFAVYAFVPSALSAQLLAIFQRFGLSAATVVAIGMLFGPSQVVARICELSFARWLDPIWTARFAVGLLVSAFVLLAVLPFSATVAAMFAVMFGMANGLLTIARGTVPLALFGASGYGRLMGRIGGPYLVVPALAPVVLTYVADRVSDAAGLGLVAAFALVALSCFVLIRRPLRAQSSQSASFSALAVLIGRRDRSLRTREDRHQGHRDLSSRMSKRITALGKQPRETLVEQEGIFALAQIRQRIELPQLAIDFAGMAHNEAAVGQAIDKPDKKF